MVTLHSARLWSLLQALAWRIGHMWSHLHLKTLHRVNGNVSFADRRALQSCFVWGYSRSFGYKPCPCFLSSRIMGPVGCRVQNLRACLPRPRQMHRHQGIKMLWKPKGRKNQQTSTQRQQGPSIFRSLTRCPVWRTGFQEEHCLHLPHTGVM